MSNATAPQIRYIEALVSERLIDLAGINSIAEELEEGITKARASELISALKATAKKVRPTQTTLPVQVVQRARISAEGFYKNDQGQVFKVVRTQDGQRFYAKLTTARGLEYVPGAMSGLFADMKMTGEAIAAHGVANAYCVNCSHELEDPTSKHIGLGTSCGPSILGKEGYKAAKARVADRPDVIAFEAAKKAAAKERREAKKRETAQLVLV
jgi:hypothetical protein